MLAWLRQLGPKSQVLDHCKPEAEKRLGLPLRASEERTYCRSSHSPLVPGKAPKQVCASRKQMISKWDQKFLNVLLFSKAIQSRAAIT